MLLVTFEFQIIQYDEKLAFEIISVQQGVEETNLVGPFPL
jgi:hypothetical protein